MLSLWGGIRRGPSIQCPQKVVGRTLGRYRGGRRSWGLEEDVRVSLDKWQT